MTLDSIERVMDHLDVPVLILDEQGDYVYVNPAAGAALGYEASEIVGMHLTDILEADPTWVSQGFEQLRRTGYFCGPVLYRIKTGGFLRGDANVFMRTLRSGDRVAVSMVHPVGFTGGPPSKVIQKVDLFGLTAGDMRLLQLLSAGLTDVQIAGVVCLTDEGLQRDMKSLLQKMGVSSRTAAAVVAIKNELVL